jgi:ribonuclease VapC
MRIAADSSALLAVLLDEPDSELFLKKLLSCHSVLVSPVDWWEVQVILKSRLAADEERVSTFPKLLEVIVARYRGRTARLNLGDCFAYALSKSKDIPLLYKEDDFSHTDIVSALSPE